MVFKVEDLWVKVQGHDKYILKGVDLSIGKGEVHVLMGPNGSGKSTLLKTIIGMPQYKIARGTILFMGKEVNNLKPYERAKMGIGIAFQSPPRIRVKTEYLIKLITTKFRTRLLPYEEYGISHLVSRDLYNGFSGGEMKRTEMYLTILQRPKLALLDEPDSGVDVDSLALIAKGIEQLMEEGASILLVTHLGYILKYLDVVTKLHVMINGKIVYSGEPEKALDLILTHGYSYFVKGGD